VLKAGRLACTDSHNIPSAGSPLLLCILHSAPTVWPEPTDCQRPWILLHQPDGHTQPAVPADGWEGTHDTLSVHLPTSLNPARYMIQKTEVTNLSYQVNMIITQDTVPNIKFNMWNCGMNFNEVWYQKCTHKFVNYNCFG
jgi:hypothetical protein